MMMWSKLLFHVKPIAGFAVVIGVLALSGLYVYERQKNALLRLEKQAAKEETNRVVASLKSAIENMEEQSRVFALKDVAAAEAAKAANKRDNRRIAKSEELDKIAKSQPVESWANTPVPADIVEFLRLHRESFDGNPAGVNRASGAAVATN